MTDVTPPRAFVGVQPCRVADTRGNGAPDRRAAILHEQRTSYLDVTGPCGIPGGADAISVNFSVVSPGGTRRALPSGLADRVSLRRRRRS